MKNFSIWVASLFILTMYPLKTQAAEKVHQEKNAGEAARVRIGLEITKWEPKVVKKRQGKSDQVKWLPAKRIRKTLRARIEKKNHFYLKNWHVETQPLKWIKEKGFYRTRLNFFTLHGAYGQVEEFRGSMVLEGQLKGSEKLFVLHGKKSASFKNKQGHTLFSVEAGFGPKATVAKKQTTPRTKQRVSKKTSDMTSPVPKKSL